MKQIMLSAAVAPLLLTTAVTSLSAQEVSILSNTTFSGEIRPRYEFVNVKENGLDKASAYTVRTRLAVSGTLMEVTGLTAKVGITSVNNFGYTDYAPEDGAYDTIVDPQQAILTEGYLAYSVDKTSFLAGRSFINLDDQRFIGTVGWRQMERAYDTLSVVNTSVENLKLLGAWVYGYQGITANPTTDTGSLLINAHYTASPELAVTGFAYMLADLHDTYGIRLTGDAQLEGAKINYAASYALQSDATLEYDLDNTPEIDADYYDLAVTANLSGIIAGLEYEVLGEANDNSTKGFTTPLATLHKFQGFADVFLGRTANSNNTGLADASLKFGYTTKELGKLLAIYHKFDALEGDNDDLGSELDLLYATKLPGVKNVNALAKAAYYSKGDIGNDVTKFWLQLDYKF